MRLQSPALLCQGNLDAHQKQNLLLLFSSAYAGEHGLDRGGMRSFG
jgi:hypothetical protein